MDSVFSLFQSFGFSVLVPEYFRKKLKNCFFQGRSRRDSPHGFSFSVFQEIFRNSSGTKIEKLKTVFSRGIQEEILYMDSVFSRDIHEEILHLDSVFHFFSFIA